MLGNEELPTGFKWRNSKIKSGFGGSRSRVTGELEEETRRKRITARGEGCAGQCPEEAAGRTWEKLLRIPGIWYDYPSIWDERKQMKITQNFLD